MAGGTTNASASAAPSWLANGAARSGEESDEEEREKRKKMNGFRRLSVQVVGLPRCLVARVGWSQQ